MKTNENKRALMKHFATVLRKQALSTVVLNEPINPQILKYFTRKDLIQIIKDKYDGTIPKHHDLMELENEDLLQIIGDDMYIITYMTQKWSKEQSYKIVPDDKGRLITEKNIAISKVATTDSKKEISKGSKTLKKK